METVISKCSKCGGDISSLKREIIALKTQLESIPFSTLSEMRRVAQSNKELREKLEQYKTYTASTVRTL